MDGTVRMPESTISGTSSETTDSGKLSASAPTCYQSAGFEIVAQPRPAVESTSGGVPPWRIPIRHAILPDEQSPL